MKKLLSLLACALMLLALFPFTATAAEPNVAPNGVAYSSADYNEWAPKRAINDQNLGSSWQAQHISRDPSVGVVGEYCGIRFAEQYYQISEIRVCVGTHGNPVTYGINVLVEGEWIELLEFSESDTTEIDGYYWMTVTPEEPIVSNNVRIVGKEYISWDLPYVREVEIYGSKAEAPDVDVPEGGLVTRNAALAGFAYASSSADGHYPALINNDKLDKSTWMPAGSDLSAYAGVKLSNVRTVNRVVVYTGADDGSPYNESLQIEALIGGEWTVIASGVADSTSNYTLEFVLEEKVSTDNVRVTFTDANTTPQLVELQVYSDERNVYMPERMSNGMKEQVASGNIAILGTPYARTTFEMYSSVIFINDGITEGKNVTWVANGADVPTYCGVTLPMECEIDKVVIQFRDEGDAPHITKYEIQVLAGEDYVKVAEGYSYNKTSGYVAILEFDPIVTSDVRVVFLKHGGTFPNLNELQIYACEGFAANPYDGYETELTYGGAVKPEGYDQAAATVEEPETYATTTRNSPNPVSPLTTLGLGDETAATVLSAALGSVAFLALAGAAFLILNKKNL